MRPDADFGASLVNYCEHLKKHGSFIVVVTTPDVWAGCDVTAQSITAEWQPASAPEVVQGCLHGSLQCPERAGWITQEPSLVSICDSDMSPGDAVRLARAIRHSEKLDEILDEFQRWRRYLHSWFRDNTDVYDRVILSAAAALGRAKDHEVIEAADGLLRAANEEKMVLQPLRAPDLIERLANTGAEPDDHHMVSLNDRRPGLDEAVMDWVWDQRPKLHEALQNWLVDLATNKASTDFHHKRMARVIAGLSIRRESGAKKLMEFASVQAGQRRKTPVLSNTDY